MKAQISRISHRADQRYSGVYQQQGRMITDADWNELVDATKERARLALSSSVGTSGVPRNGGALTVTDRRTAPGVVQTSAELGWGKVVVDGILAEVIPSAGATAAFDYAKQRDFPFAPAPPVGDLTYYVDVWERLVVSLQDDNLRDSALHGVDTCVRLQVLAQIKCSPSIGAFTDPDQNPPRGNARLELQRPDNATDVGDPCATVTPIASDLGNYLFRLEVHDVKGRAGAPDSVTLKWSSENGAEAHAVGSEPPEFMHGGWVYDFFSEVSEHHLGVQLTGPSNERSVLATNGYPTVTPSDARGKPFPFVRRWDGYCILRHDAGGWALVEGKHLGEGLVQLEAAPSTATLNLRLGALELRLSCDGKRFVAGDYWLALLREHPEGRQPELLSNEPSGIVHHYLRLLTRTSAGTTFPVDAASVQRLAFPALTELVATRVGYDPTIATNRWRDINESGTTPPVTVQDAIDQLAQNLDAADIPYALPGCGTNTVEALFQSVPHWPDLDQDGLTSVQDLFKALLCHLDASRLPYAAAAAGTIKSYLDALQADVNTRVKIAGDTMTGNLIVNAQIGISEASPGGKLHVRGGHAAKNFHPLNTAIEVDNSGPGNAVLQADGAVPFRLAVKDGLADVSQTLNAYDSPGGHRYDTANAATWLRFDKGSFSVRVAPAGAVDAAIPWKVGVHVDSAGNVGINKDSPGDPLDVSGRVSMTGFRMPTAATNGYVLTSDASGVGTWKAAVGNGWGISGTNVVTAVTGNVGIGTTSPPVAKLDVRGDVSVTGNIAVTGTVDGVDVSALKTSLNTRISRYTELNHFNVGSTTVSGAWAPLNIGPQTFLKNHPETLIEVSAYCRVDAGTFAGSRGIQFQLRINGLTGAAFSTPAIVTSKSTEFLPLFAAFETLGLGTHTVTIWAISLGGGSSTGVLVDPGDMGGRIIVKETW